MSDRLTQPQQERLDVALERVKATARAEERERIARAVEAVESKGFLTVAHVLRIVRGGAA